MIHTLKDKADWEYISPKDYNTWQKIAEFTRGFITPGNFASLLGIVLVFLGLHELVNHHFLLGSILLALGRLCDLLDGTLAEYTGTKCQVGEMLDTGTDKIAIFISAIVIALNDLTPAYIIVTILGINILSVCLSLIARMRHIVIHPSKAGKFFTALSWVAIISYLYSYAIAGLPQDILRGFAHAAFVGTLGLGILALYGYSRSALGKHPKGKVPDYEHIVVVQNPKSSHTKRAERRIKELQRLYGENAAQVILTTKDSTYKKTLRETLSQLHGKVLLCIGGGDGTVHHVANIVLALQPHKNIVLLPLWGGNANDFGYMLNGLSVNKKLKSLVRLGREVTIYPLEILVSVGKKETTYHAVCYASFGASAYAAHHLDKASLSRKGSLHSLPVLLIIREALQVSRALIQAPTFKAEIGDKKVEIFEQVFTNGSRIAKIDRLPVRLTDKEFYRAVQPAKHPQVLVRLLKTLQGKPFGAVTKKPHSFTTKEPVLAQFDGEVAQLPANATVTVRLAKTSIKALSTKL
jgi:phosphatidylglycerophosphate synthase/diacylglycerol kinase family enzyme